MVKPPISVTVLILLICSKLNIGHEISQTKVKDTESNTQLYNLSARKSAVEFNESPMSSDFKLTPFKRPKRIIDGEISKIEEFPYLVYVHTKNSYHCAGSIISRHRVLIAAHCIDNEKNPRACIVRAGSSTWKDSGSVHRVKNITRHPDFRKDKHDYSQNDLAVLLLEKPLAFNNKTIGCIAMFNQGEEVRPGSVARATGWGHSTVAEDAYLSDQLRSMDMKVVDKRSCEESYEDVDGIQPGEICAVADRNNQSICTGDSGGPLVIGGRLAGILTNAAENCSMVRPNVMTEIAYFRSWIDETVEDLGPKNTTGDLCRG